MKKFSSYRDIINNHGSIFDRCVLSLRPFGVVPSRPKFKTKVEATKFTYQAFERRLRQLVTYGILPKNTERDVIDDGTGMTTLMLETN